MTDDKKFQADSPKDTMPSPGADRSGWKPAVLRVATLEEAAAKRPGFFIEELVQHRVGFTLRMLENLRELSRKVHTLIDERPRHDRSDPIWAEELARAVTDLKKLLDSAGV